ncbi:MAG: spore protease YyaC [Peptococcaceae bacterium]|jgi:putative sporulation protein YyaC|nr:spore protease YyaC [Peptococcaceae bacterium]
MQAVQEKTFPTAPKFKIHMEDTEAPSKLARELIARINASNLRNREIVLLCIGTDRSTGDALGPLVGSRLAGTRQQLFTVYGSLDQPVHASNLREKLAEIERCHRNPFIVAVDACLGHLDSVGCVNVGDGSLLPGAGVHKPLPPVGEVHITAIVNVGGFLEYLVLQNTRLNLVMQLADLIADSLLLAAREIAPAREEYA